MSARRYLDAAIAALQQVAQSQADSLAVAADRLLQVIVEGHAIYSFGASHSFMTTEELVYRTGGLMLVNPIYPHGMNLFVRPLPLTSRLERLPGLGAELLRQVPLAAGDAVLVTSTSGRNAVAIDLARAAREHGAWVLGLTSLAYSAAVESRHPDGLKLTDVCDLVLDNGAPVGDAAVAIDGLAQPTGPISSITGCALVNALIAETLQRLVDAGHTPPVFMSANIDGGDAHNAALLQANRDRIHYL